MKHQFMPMFWGDFLANTLNLSAQEVGAYVLLIAHAWEHGGVIPYQEARRIARVEPKHWPKVERQLLPFFEVERDAKALPIRLCSARVLKELAKAEELSNKRKAAGMAGAIKKWQLPLAIAIENDGKRIAKPMAKRWQSTKKERSSSFPLPRARATSVDNPETEPEETPQGATDKKVSEVSRAELDAIYAAKRPKEGDP